MKFISDGFLCLLLISSPFISALISFIQGFSSRHFLSPFPAEGVFFLFALIIAILLIVRLIEAWRKRCLNKFKFTRIAFSLVVFLTLVVCIPSSSYWFLLGFREGIIRRLSSDQLEQVATAIRHIVPVGGLMLPPTASKLRGGANNAEMWSAFLSEAPVDELPQPFVVYNRDNTIELEWGSSLTGHWGIRFSTPVIRKSRDIDFLPISSTVAVFYK